MACVVLLWCSCAQAADTQAYLLRGWFGVFSTGMDELAEELRAQGIKADAVGHTSWQSTLSRIVRDKASGSLGALVLVGHSQGAINAIEIARGLKAHKIPVDLLVTLVPSMQNPVPANVVQALNFYQNPGWGSPLRADRDFRGKLSNIDLSSSLTVTHITIDKTAKVQAEIVRAALAIPKPGEGAQPGGSAKKDVAGGKPRR
jgi:surfactin synthase thioesterase subunit